MKFTNWTFSFHDLAGKEQKITVLLQHQTKTYQIKTQINRTKTKSVMKNVFSKVTIVMMAFMSVVVIAMVTFMSGTAKAKTAGASAKSCVSVKSNDAVKKSASEKSSAAVKSGPSEKDIAILHCKQGASYKECYEQLSNAYGEGNVIKSVDNGAIKVLSVENILFNSFKFDEIKFSFDKSKLVGVKMTRSFSDDNLMKAMEERDDLFNFLSEKYKATKTRIPDFQAVADYGLGYTAHKNTFDYPLFIFLSQFTSTTTTDGKDPVTTKGWDLELTYWCNDFDNLYAKYPSDNY